MATSKDLYSGVSFQEVCDAADLVVPTHVYKVLQTGPAFQGLRCFCPELCRDSFTAEQALCQYNAVGILFPTAASFGRSASSL